jgi:hypothetical protein
MSKTQKTVLVGVGLVLLVGYMMYLSMSPGQISCEVCIEFNGRTECRKAIGKDQEEAQRSATSTACGLISGGVTDGIACQNTTPKKLSCEKR